MSKQWTDKDVARMLGWEMKGDNDFPICRAPNGGTWRGVPPFGLSTPPGPEADANAARYVLPWLRARGAYVRLEYAANAYQVDVCGDSGIQGAEGEFSTALCTAALEAYHAGRS